MKKFAALAALVILFGVGTAEAASWTDSLNTAIANRDYNQINVIGASNPGQQGAIAVYLLQQSQQYKGETAREVRLFVSAAPFAGRIQQADVGTATEVIGSLVKFVEDKDFQKTHPRETSDVFLAALNMSSQPNISGSDPSLHADVLAAADDFVKEHPQDADKRLLEQVQLAESGGAPEGTPRGVIAPNPNGTGGPGGTSAGGGSSVTGAVQTAIANNNYNQINVIGAANPGQQGAIAVYLLQQSQSYGGTPQREARVFAAATPFVGRIPAHDAGTATDIIANIIKIAEDKDFQQKHPREAADIFLSSLNMSAQPNIVAYEPNLHAEVLEAANDFIKEHPQDADKKLLEEVSLAEAGGAPESTPRGVIQPIPHGNQPPPTPNPCANNPSCE
jgi:hypothetical protein